MNCRRSTRENHQDCTLSGKEVCPDRPEKPARLRTGATVTIDSAEGDPRDEPIDC